MIFICQTCNITFKNSHQRKYCSRKCHGIAHSKKMQGHRYFGGGLPEGEKHPNWKGNHATYLAIHIWIYRRLGKAMECMHCKTKIAKRYEWANVSHEYKRDLDDWIQLCCNCHYKYDKPFKGYRQKRFGG